VSRPWVFRFPGPDRSCFDRLQNAGPPLLRYGSFECGWPLPAPPSVSRAERRPALVRTQKTSCREVRFNSQPERGRQSAGRPPFCPWRTPCATILPGRFRQPSRRRSATTALSLSSFFLHLSPPLQDPPPAGCGPALVSAAVLATNGAAAGRGRDAVQAKNDGFSPFRAGTFSILHDCLADRGDGDPSSRRWRHVLVGPQWKVARRRDEEGGVFCFALGTVPCCPLKSWFEVPLPRAVRPRGFRYVLPVSRRCLFALAWAAAHHTTTAGLWVPLTGPHFFPSTSPASAYSDSPWPYDPPAVLINYPPGVRRFFFAPAPGRGCCPPAGFVRHHCLPEERA